MFKTLRSKLIAACILAALLPLSVASIHGYQEISASLKVAALKGLTQEADLLAGMMERWLSSVGEDIHVISQLELFQDLVQARDEGDQAETRHRIEDIQKVFLTLSEVRGRYYQVGYIDEMGTEVLRIDSDGTRPYVVPAGDLQNMADRSYFVEAMKLGPGEVYVSPLDLNQERGTIEVPYRPVIRYAAPVFNERVRRKGIVIINVFGKKLLEDTTGGRPTGRILIIDQEGYYVAHPEAAKEWGGPRDLNSGESVWKDYSEDVAARLLSGAPGVLDDGQGNLAGIAAVRAGGLRWILVVRRPVGQVLAPVIEHQTGYLVYAGGSLALGVVVAYLLSRQLAGGMAALEEGALAIAAGDLDYHISVRTGDEVERVAEAFHTMTHQVRDAYIGTVRALAIAVETRDEYTSGHIARVAD